MSAEPRKIRNHTPRVKMGLRLYHTGAARTQREAAAVAGCTKEMISIAGRTEGGRALVEKLTGGIDERAMSLSAVIAKLSERAVGKMAGLMEQGSTEQIQFQAAKDLLDRNPETSKHSRLQVESFTLSGKDAQEIATALVEGAKAKEEFPQLASGDFVKVEDQSRSDLPG